MLIRRVFVSLLLIWVMAATYADEGVVATPAPVETVRRVIRAAALDRMVLIAIRQELEQNNRKVPDRAVDPDIFMASMTLDAAADRLAAAYAPYLSADYADKLVVAYATPVGKLSTRFALLVAESGPQAVKAAFAKLPTNDRRALNEFHASATYLSLLNAQRKALVDSRKMFENWGAELMAARIRQVRDEMAMIVEGQLKFDAGDTSSEANLGPAKLARTGFRPLDQSFAIMYDFLCRNAILNRKLARELHKFETQKVLSPQNLVSREGIESGSLAVLSVETVIDDYYKQSEALMNETNQSISKTPLPAEFRQQLETSLTKQFGNLMDIQIRASERQRSILEIIKRILSFCESRLGKLQVQGDKLLLPDSADVQTYNGLLDQLRKEEAEQERILQEDQERRRLVLNKMRAM